MAVPSDVSLAYHRPMADAHALILERLVAFARPHFLASEDLHPPDTEALLSLAEAFGAAHGPLPDLMGDVRLACIGDEAAQGFATAARRLGAETIETLTDATTARPGGIKADLMVLSHPVSGAAQAFAAHGAYAVINAGDGAHQAPVQALGDLLCLRRALGGVDGCTIAIVGDIAHSPVARSNAIALSHAGALIRLIGPATLIPGDAESWGCDISHDLNEGLGGVNAVLIQPLSERRLVDRLIPSLREYGAFFGLTPARLRRAHEGVRVLHGRPVRPGVEIADELIDDAEVSLIAAQARARADMRLSVLAAFAVRLEDER